VSRRIILTSFAALVCSVSALAAELPEAAQAEIAPDPRPLCIDAVVLARFVKYHPTDIPDLGPDVIVVNWPWNVDIEVRTVLLGDLGRGRLTIGAWLHATFNDKLRQPVLFLSRTTAGGWYLAEIRFAARDGHGGYVLPLFDSPYESEIVPKGWLPADYARWLQPVDYHPGDMQPYEDNGRKEPDGENAWVRIKGDRLTAKRGFRASDLPAMLEQRRALECRRQ
jgi:hypothetical protein